MEEELPPPQSDLSSPNPSSSIDTTLQKKHQAMLDRLSNRHQSRQKTATTPTTIDSTASFLFKFTESKRSIESLLNNSPNTPDPTLLKSHLANISSSISSLEKLVAESSYFLPPYELRSSLKCIENLKQSLENLNSQLLPKKKFSFKNKSTNPIIEDCGGVRFAPYCLRYVGIEEDLTEAGLEEENESWGNVDDFKWLRAVKSPNWSVLEESERIGCVEIEGSGSIETEVEIEKV
ncbi:hypothetical protein OIU76_002667 [Salix suchowensis]|uniref:C-CAP/cofactor C-like domain-containing protein n=1 Tax=Salix suchowensis TaxID=1278906 RepID=A0ABQ9CE04_9ROSI|nr:hypothetical protein OIU76_002667 [Salix suchowensis]KAJ6397924.1 hypothetical protein OIU77_018857 [Salix suchowensis]